MVNHFLKIDKGHLQDLLSGVKKFEIRFNDRDYKVGDNLIYSKHGSHHFKITHTHDGLGVKYGFIILSIESCIDK